MPLVWWPLKNFNILVVLVFYRLIAKHFYHLLHGVYSLVEIACFDIVSLMIGRRNVRRSKEWYMASVEEFIKVVLRVNSNCLLLLGAVIPGLQDACWMIREFLARNNLLLRRCLEGRDRYRLEYMRPGKVLLSKGGPVPRCYGMDNKLSQEGLKHFRNAIVDKFFSADLAVRALRLRSRRS